MPRAARHAHAPLDNHDARSTVHTAVNIQTVSTVTHNNRRNLHRLSTYTSHTGLVQHGATGPSEPPTAEEFYTTLDPYLDDATMADADERHDGPPTLAGPSGITIVPKHKAKRYENSVCDFPTRKPPNC